MKPKTPPIDYWPRRRDPYEDVHPAIRGMILLLPIPGAAWPREQRELWLTAMNGILDLIYHDPPAPVQIVKLAELIYIDELADIEEGGA